MWERSERRWGVKGLTRVGWGFRGGGGSRWGRAGRVEEEAGGYVRGLIILLGSEGRGRKQGGVVRRRKLSERGGSRVGATRG